MQFASESHVSAQDDTEKEMRGLRKSLGPLLLIVSRAFTITDPQPGLPSTLHAAKCVPSGERLRRFDGRDLHFQSFRTRFSKSADRRICRSIW